MVTKKVLLSEAAKEYHEMMERTGKAYNTTRADKTIVSYLIAMVGDIQTKHITKHHVEKMFYGSGGLTDVHEVRSNGKTSNAGVSAATHNQYRLRLKVFFDWLADHGMMDHRTAAECFHPKTGVVRRRKVPKKKRQRPRPVVLLSLLENANNPRDRGYLAMALNTSKRSNEIIRMTYGDLDLDEGYIDVTMSKTNDEDTMRINPDLDAEMRRWLIQYQSDLGRPLEDDDYLFPARTKGMIRGWHVDSETGERTMIREPLQWTPKKPILRSEGIVQAALRAVGLPTKYEGTHTLRRAVARALYDKLCEEGHHNPLRATMAFLGHANAATTEVYIGADRDREDRDRIMEKPFLTAMVSQENVVQLRPTAGGE